MTYIRGADAAVYRATGFASEWHARYEQRFEKSAEARDDPESRTARPVILSGRSIYYGALLYASYLVGGLRLAAFMQALLAAACLHMTVRRFVRGERRRVRSFLVLIAMTSFGSSLAFFTSYLVPDLFAGLAILAAAHLLSSEPQLKPDMIFWLLILCASCVMHSSILLIIAILVTVMLIVSLTWNAPARGRIALLGLGLFVGLASEAIYYKSVQMTFGDPPVRPPFVMARLIADGPGALYLRDRCPESGFTVCRYADRVPKSPYPAYSDAFLWSADPTVGVFTAADFDERRRIAAEETSFVAAVFTSDPLAVIRSTLGAVGVQATKWQLIEFNLNSAAQSGFAAELPPSQMRLQARTLAFNKRMPVTLVERMTLAFALLSLLSLLWLFARGTLDQRMRLFVCVLLLGVTADVIVCGAMSTPHDRYLMRVVWLVPLGAYLCLTSREGSSNKQVAEDCLATDSV
jgi:hypothetical protein